MYLSLYLFLNVYPTGPIIFLSFSTPNVNEEGEKKLGLLMLIKILLSHDHKQRQGEFKN